jgi:hypothetical protein
MPGDPVEATMRPGVPEEYKNQIRHDLGIDRPILFNFQGTLATANGPFIVLYEEHDTSSAPVMLALEGDQLSVTDRFREGDEDWVRVTIEAEEPAWIAEEKLKWLRRVEFHFKEVEGAELPAGVEGEWKRVTLSSGGVEGWGPAGSFDIAINPFDSQFFNYLWGLVTRFDLGKSITLRGRPIAADLALKFPATVELGIFGMLVASVVGVFTGALAAQKRRSATDYGLRIYSIVAYAIPIFWLGLMFQLIFGVGLGWLPVADAPRYDYAGLRATGATDGTGRWEDPVRRRFPVQLLHPQLPGDRAMGEPAERAEAPRAAFVDVGALSVGQFHASHARQHA